MSVKKNTKIALLHSFLGLLSISSTLLFFNFEIFKELIERFHSIFSSIVIYSISTFIVTFVLLKLLRNKFFISLFSGILNLFLFFFLDNVFEYLLHFFCNELENLCSCQQDFFSLIYKSIFCSSLTLYYIGWLTIIISFISVFLGNKIFKDNCNDKNI